ncbi:MAG: type II secretion system inner membrane protein GspF, partial [Desulfobulbaceae bacterium]|nr:type II secretion system inner membrane protein GspF [Desulfobulbaceae bacterium]
NSCRFPVRPKNRDDKHTMPVYEYSALTEAGKKIKGIIDAESNSAARQKIRHAGNYPVDIKETTPLSRNRQVGKLASILSAQRVRSQEVHLITRQLATLLNAGIPLVQALNGLIEQTENQALQKIIAQVKDAVNEGNSLTKALSDHPRIFSKIYINMVRAGETSGSLDVVLERLAEFGEQREAMKSRVNAALMYPFFMVFVGAIVLFLLLTFIVPNITKVFEDTKSVLPMPTIILISISDFLRNYWWLTAGFIISISASLHYAIQQPKGKRISDKLKLNLPLLGPLNTKVAAASFSRTLANLLQSGVPLITSLGIVKNILNNVLLAEEIDHANEELAKGRSLSEILKQSQWFPPMLVQMVSVGEQSGALESMLEKTANNYEKEVESKIMGLTSLIEPVMILGMAVIVLFIIVSIMLPILDMNQLVR